jgi:hypothetical protein
VRAGHRNIVFENCKLFVDFSLVGNYISIFGNFTYS